MRTDCIPSQLSFQGPGRRRIEAEFDAGMVAQRIYGIALGYEDLDDHEELRRDPLLATLVGKTDPLGRERARERDRGCALAGHHSREGAASSPFTRTSTARAATWKTGSRSSSWISSPIGPVPRFSRRTNCGFTSPASPMCCCSPCAASDCSEPISHELSAGRSVSSSSRSERWSRSACDAYASAWPAAIPIAISSGGPYPTSRRGPALPDRVAP